MGVDNPQALPAMPKSAARRKGLDAAKSATRATTTEALEPADDELAVLAAALEAANERFMRASAEADNIRRRAERQVEEAHKYALEKFARELLGVQDSLDQAMQIELDDAASAAVAPMREGISLIARQFGDTLARFSIQPVDPAPGDAFDPELHQAVSTQAAPDMPAGRVVQVIQKGFCLQQRLLRPAMVIVSAEAG